MKKIIIPIALIIIIITSIFIPKINAKKVEEKNSKVYFSSEISPESIVRLFEKINKDVKGKVAIKVHFGEDGNKYYVKPEMIILLQNKLQATLVETNVLYRGRRRETESHLQLAREHGFGFAPLDILNSTGEKELPIKGKHFDKIYVGKKTDNYDSYVILSHFKGHAMAGFGGAIKNVSMGMAAIPGKMAMHASEKPVERPGNCISCGLCLKECPADAISLEPLVIDTEKCIGCGKCIGVCPTYSLSVPWGSTKLNIFNERLVEYAKGISENYNLVYINVLADISSQCDCSANAPEPFVENIGILASTDMLAIDNASHDLVNEKCGCEDAFKKQNYTSGKSQIEYGAQIGLGNKNYELIKID